MYFLVGHYCLTKWLNHGLGKAEQLAFHEIHSAYESSRVKKEIKWRSMNH